MKQKYASQISGGIGGQQQQYYYEYEYPPEYYYETYPQEYYQNLDQYIDYPPGFGVDYYGGQGQEYEYFYVYEDDPSFGYQTSQLQWNDFMNFGPFGEVFTYSERIGETPCYFAERKLKNGGTRRVRLLPKSYELIRKKNTELRTRGMARKEQQAKREEVPEKRPVPQNPPTVVKKVVVVKRP